MEVLGNSVKHKIIKCLSFSLALLSVLAFVRTAAADSSAPLPVGTVITRANCAKYLDHMVEVLAHECTSTAVQTSIPNDYKIVIAPTGSYPLPASYWAATEKYSKQVTLEPTGDGSYRMKNYIAGQPFPYAQLSTSDPLAGYKLMYDAYFQYEPARMIGYGLRSILTDRYGNRSETDTITGAYMLSHNTDPAYPMTMPNSPGTKGVYEVFYSELLFPTQLQYISGVEWDYADPDHIPQNWAFIPSIRRVLELSQAARCAPYTATSNFSYDDHSRIQLPATWFKAQYLGTKYEIGYVVPTDRLKAATDDKNWEFPYQQWPRPSLGGHWETRPYLQLATERVPRYATGYCEAKHYIWLDKQQTATVDYDDFDQNGKFWRGEYNFLPVKPVPGGGYSFYNGTFGMQNPDFQNLSNSSLRPFPNFWYNQDIPARYMNLDRYATPAGLNQVVQ
jgi:hypothetical protein